MGVPWQAATAQCYSMAVAATEQQGGRLRLSSEWWRKSTTEWSPTPLVFPCPTR